MEYTKELLKFLKLCGYSRLHEERPDLWVKTEEQCCYLIYVIPERLPGQPAVDWDQIMDQEKILGNQMMIRSGRPVDWLTLAVFEDYPGNKERQKIEKYHNVWCLSRTEGKIIVYENQREDYEKLRLPLEEFALRYLEMKSVKGKERESVFRMLTPMNTGIVLINVLVFLVLSCLGDVTDAGFMAEHGAMYQEAIINRGEYYRMFTSMFLHFGMEHLSQNMLILLLIGPRLEKITGKIPYLLIYVGSGLLAAMASVMFTQQSDVTVVAAGASGAIFGVMGSLLALILRDVVTRQRARIRDIGMRGILFMILSALSYGFMETGIDNADHLGGLAGGFLLTLLLTLLSVV